jgi:hypothetical protein
MVLNSNVCSVILFTSQNLQIYILNAFQATTAGTLYMALSALIVILLQPVFATFKSAAAEAGGPAAAAVERRLIQTELLSSAWIGFFAGC